MMSCFFVPGFERGKEDLLPLPLKEDSHSISKSKVRKITPLSCSVMGGEERLGALACVSCNESREYGNYCMSCFLSQSCLRREIAHIGMTHTSFKLYTSNIYQLKFRLSPSFK